MPFRSPKSIVEAVCNEGVAKARLSLLKQLVLGFLAGAFVAFGGLLAIAVGKGSPELARTNPGLAELASGAVFPLGFILVAVAGAELFTENCAVLIPTCLAGAAKWRGLLRNWVVVYVSNFLGSLFVTLFLAYWSGIANGGDLGKAAAGIAEAKVNLGWWQVFLRGIGCNWLVCLAVWLAVASDEVIGKIFGIWFPIMAFVTLGFEHSVANMFFIPLGMFNGANVSVSQFLWNNLVPSTLGNIIGGAGLVGGLYWWIYGRE